MSTEKQDAPPEGAPVEEPLEAEAPPEVPPPAAVEPAPPVSGSPIMRVHNHDVVLVGEEVPSIREASGGNITVNSVSDDPPFLPSDPDDTWFCDYVSGVQPLARMSSEGDFLGVKSGAVYLRHSWEDLFTQFLSALAASGSLFTAQLAAGWVPSIPSEVPYGVSLATRERLLSAQVLNARVQELTTPNVTSMLWRGFAGRYVRNPDGRGHAALLQYAWGRSNGAPRVAAVGGGPPNVDGIITHRGIADVELPVCWRALYEPSVLPTPVEDTAYDPVDHPFYSIDSTLVANLPTPALVPTSGPLFRRVCVGGAVPGLAGSPWADGDGYYATLMHPTVIPDLTCFYIPILHVGTTVPAAVPMMITPTVSSSFSSAFALVMKGSPSRYSIGPVIQAEWLTTANRATVLCLVMACTDVGLGLCPELALDYRFVTRLVVYFCAVWKDPGVAAMMDYVTRGVELGSSLVPMPVSQWMRTIVADAHVRAMARSPFSDSWGAYWTVVTPRARVPLSAAELRARVNRPRTVLSPVAGTAIMLEGTGVTTNSLPSVENLVTGLSFATEPRCASAVMAGRSFVCGSDRTDPNPGAPSIPVLSTVYDANCRAGDGSAFGAPFILDALRQFRGSPVMYVGGEAGPSEAFANGNPISGSSYIDLQMECLLGYCVRSVPGESFNADPAQKMGTVSGSAYAAYAGYVGVDGEGAMWRYARGLSRTVTARHFGYSFKWSPYIIGTDLSLRSILWSSEATRRVDYAFPRFVVYSMDEYDPAAAFSFTRTTIDTFLSGYYLFVFVVGGPMATVKTLYICPMVAVRGKHLLGAVPHRSVPVNRSVAVGAMQSSVVYCAPTEWARTAWPDRGLYSVVPYAVTDLDGGFAAPEDIPRLASTPLRSPGISAACEDGRIIALPRFDEYAIPRIGNDGEMAWQFWMREFLVDEEPSTFATSTIVVPVDRLRLPPTQWTTLAGVGDRLKFSRSSFVAEIDPPTPDVGWIEPLASVPSVPTEFKATSSVTLVDDYRSSLARATYSVGSAGSRQPYHFNMPPYTNTMNTLDATSPASPPFDLLLTPHRGELAVDAAPPLDTRFRISRRLVAFDCRGVGGALVLNPSDYPIFVQNQK